MDIEVLFSMNNSALKKCSILRSQNFLFDKMYEKRHCCCCVPLHEGVALVGVYGTAFHTALLVVQVSVQAGVLCSAAVHSTMYRRELRHIDWKHN